LIMVRKRFVGAGAAILLVAGSALAAIGNDQKESSRHGRATVSGTPTQSQRLDDERLREGSERVCRQAVSAAALLGETLEAISAELLPMVARNADELARAFEPTMHKLEPTMRELAERARDIAKRFEQSMKERSSR
jgi:hypothetical protein